MLSSLRSGSGGHSLLVVATLAHRFILPHGSFGVFQVNNFSNRALISKQPTTGPDWPQFRRRHGKLAGPLAAVRHQQGRLIGHMKALSFRSPARGCSPNPHRRHEDSNADVNRSRAAPEQHQIVVFAPLQTPVHRSEMKFEDFISRPLNNLCAGHVQRHLSPKIPVLPSNREPGRTYDVPGHQAAQSSRL
jgi:hypothetical protein